MDFVGSAGVHFDQLAYSGAPSQPNAYTGKNDKCTYPRGQRVPTHYAVSPEELDAANMKADPVGFQN